MKSVGIGARLVVLALAAALLLPLQLLAVRAGWRLAERIPVVFHRLLLRLVRVRVVVRGALPQPGRAALVLANHVSWMDIPVLGSLLPVSFVAKSEVAGWPVVGLLARMQRCIFIDRARKSHTTHVNTEVAHRLARGDLIVLFPEGTTGDGNRLLPFRSSLVGAARAALTEPTLERIDLQPLAVVYVRRNGLPVTRRERPAIAWYGDMELAPHLAAFVRAGSVDAVVQWGEPIPFDTASDRKRATAAAEAAVRSAVEEAARLGGEVLRPLPKGLSAPSSAPCRLPWLFPWSPQKSMTAPSGNAVASRQARLREKSLRQVLRLPDERL
jgi:lyso-ornithine lipid O-acyltransferase